MRRWRGLFDEIHTEEEIMATFWPKWVEYMKNIGAPAPSITKENCIEDWTVVNFATLIGEADARP